MQVVVTRAHVSNYPDPVCFEPGEILALGEMDTEFPGWIRVTTADNNLGWAPQQYIAFTPGADNGKALRHYNARELNTCLGEVLTVVLELNSWYQVINAENQLGWVPVCSVQPSQAMAKNKVSADSLNVDER